MKKIIKKHLKILLIIMITLLVSVSTTVLAVNRIHSRNVSFTPENSKFDANNVNDALDYLYENKESGGYVGLLSGSYSISTSEKNLPVVYLNDKYATRDGDTITFTYPGTYQVIATASHSTKDSRYATIVQVYFNNDVLLDDDNSLYSAIHTPGSLYYNMLNREIEVKSGDLVSVKLLSDGSVDGLSSGTVVIIKK